MALNYVTTGLNDEHLEKLEDLCAAKKASKTAVMRMALRVLTLIEERRADGFMLIWRKTGEEYGSLDHELSLIPETVADTPPPGPEPVAAAEVSRSKRHIVIAPTYNAALEWGRDHGVDRQFIIWPVELRAVVGLDFTQFEVAITGRWSRHAGCVTLIEYIRNHRTWAKGRKPLV